MARQDLKGKVAIVTGASSGVGWQTAVRLGEEGVKLCVTARRVEALEKLRHQLEERGVECIAVPGDVTVQADVEQVVRECLAHYGRVDISGERRGSAVLWPLRRAAVGAHHAHLRHQLLWLHALRAGGAAALPASGQWAPPQHPVDAVEGRGAAAVCVQREQARHAGVGEEPGDGVDGDGNPGVEHPGALGIEQHVRARAHDVWPGTQAGAAHVRHGRWWRERRCGARGARGRQWCRCSSRAGCCCG